jgi:hypothetical protein
MAEIWRVKMDAFFGLVGLRDVTSETESQGIQEWIQKCLKAIPVGAGIKKSGRVGAFKKGLQSPKNPL